MSFFGTRVISPKRQRKVPRTAARSPAFSGSSLCYSMQARSNPQPPGVENGGNFPGALLTASPTCRRNSSRIFCLRLLTAWRLTPHSRARSSSQRPSQKSWQMRPRSKDQGPWDIGSASRPRLERGVSPPSGPTPLVGFPPPGLRGRPVRTTVSRPWSRLTALTYGWRSARSLGEEWTFLLRMTTPLALSCIPCCPSP